MAFVRLCSLQRLVLVLSLLVIAHRAQALSDVCSSRPLAPQRSSQLVVFALLRGGLQREQYDAFVSSRKCLRGVLSAMKPFDDVAFHDGNVPKHVQAELQIAM